MEVIKFRGQDLYVGTAPNGARVVAIKPICESIGIAYQAQWVKVKGDPKFNYCDIPTVGADGKRVPSGALLLATRTSLNRE